MLTKNTLLVHIPQHLIFAASIGTCFLGVTSFAWLFITYCTWIVIGYFGFSVWYHRYFAHRAFQTYRIWEIIFGYLGLLVGRGSPINMASLHMTHHQHADTERDPHSPNQGWVWSWFTWAENHKFKLNARAARHLLRDKYLLFLDRHYLKLFWSTFVILIMLDWRFACFGMMGAGVLHYHIEGAVNTFGHNLGVRDWNTNDDSRNLRGPFNWFTLGTGLHNNHHYKQSSFHYALMPGDFDLAKFLVPLFIKPNAVHKT